MKKKLTEEQIKRIEYYANLATPTPVVGNHLTEEEICAFFFELMEDEEFSQAENHLDSCLKCAEALVEFEQLVEEKATQQRSAFDALTEEEKQRKLQAHLDFLRTAESNARSDLDELQKRLVEAEAAEAAELLEKVAPKIIAVVQQAFTDIYKYVEGRTAVAFDSASRPQPITLSLEETFDEEFRVTYDSAVKKLFITTVLDVDGFEIQVSMGEDKYIGTFEMQPFNKKCVASIPMESLKTQIIDKISIKGHYDLKFEFTSNDVSS